VPFLFLPNALTWRSSNDLDKRYNHEKNLALSFSFFVVENMQAQTTPRVALIPEPWRCKQGRVYLHYPNQLWWKHRLEVN
jgi:hypothetical protein